MDKSVEQQVDVSLSLKLIHKKFKATKNPLVIITLSKHFGILPHIYLGMKMFPGKIDTFN